MSVSPFLSFERKVGRSPVWLRLVDSFTLRAPLGPIHVVTERREGAQWVTTAHIPYLLKGNGDLAFINLGRATPGQVGDQFDLRVTPTVGRAIVEASSGEPSITLTITKWSPDVPPPAPALQKVTCYPGPDYRFGPGVPIVSGQVVNSAANPVPRARVRATEIISTRAVTEEVRTGDDGWFRLPLRWSSGSTQIDADRLGATGSTTIDVPADLASIQLITLS